MEWDLVCERKGLRATAQSLFMVGVLAGSYLFGWLSDKMGRKVSFFISVVVMAVFGILSGLVPEYWSFIVMRMVVGASTSGVFLVAYVLAMEMVGPRYRVVAGTLCQYYYTAGYIFMAGVAFSLNQDWHLLQVVLSVPCLLFLSYWWIVPESVRQCSPLSLVQVQRGYALIGRECWLRQQSYAAKNQLVASKAPY